jgi:hypothetical protein
MGGAGDDEFWELSNPDTLAGSFWTNRGSNHQSPSFNGPNTACFDPIDQQVIKCVGAVGTYFYSTSNLTTPAHVRGRSALEDESQYMASCVDTTNHVLLTWRTQDNRFQALNLANKSGSVQTMFASGPLPTSAASGGGALSFHWHAPLNCFITWSGDGPTSVKKLTPIVGGGSYTGITWSDLTPLGSGGTAPPPTSLAMDPSGGGNVHGMFNKVNYIHDMGDGHAALVCLLRYNAMPQVYVFKL